MAFGTRLSDSSLLDVLLRMMPGLDRGKGKGFEEARKKMKTNVQAAKALMDIWDSKEMKISSKKFRKPKTVASADVSHLEKEGLITASGDNIEITAKGAYVIKQMILGDDRSSFEDNGRKIDYVTACANLKRSRKLAKYAEAEFNTNQSTANWYQLMKKEMNG